MPAAHPQHVRAPLATPKLIAGLGLALAWLVCTAFDVTKAVHIDDTAHLAIAEHIRADPTHPMSGTVFWGEVPAPIHHLNQPHLFFYLLAAVLALTDGSLVAAHLLVSIFTGLCAFFGYRLGRALGLEPRSAALAAALVLMGPAFIPSQNLMTDVPTLALWLGSFDAMARARDDRRRYTWLAGLYVGLACLMKYTSLVLVPILVLDAVVRRRGVAAWAAAIPVVLLASWSLFNVWDYGAVHILGRPLDAARVGGPLATTGVMFGRAGLFVLTLGAVCPFTVGALPRSIERRGGKIVVATVVGFLTFGLAVGQSLAAWGPIEMRGEPVVMSLLRGVFVLNGLYAMVLLREAMSKLQTDGRTTALLSAWIGLTALFVIVFSPFVAVRHVLLVVPAVVLALVTSEVLPRDVRALALTAALGVFVAAGDAETADAYRDVAPTLSDDARRTYFVGHWGFQHYAERAGLVPYVPGQSQLSTCDRLVRPHNVDQQSIRDDDRARLDLVEERVIEATLLDLPRTITSRLGFYSVWHGLPYTLTLEPVDAFDVYEVAPEECASRALATASR